MKAENVYLLIARDVITDPADNMNSIIKIIDNFTTNLSDKDWEETKSNLDEGQNAATNISYFIASSWRFDNLLDKKTTFKVRITISDPTGKYLEGPTQEHEFPAKVGNITVNFKMDVLPITQAGTYVLQAELITKDGKILAEAEYPYEVKLTFN